MTSDLVRSVWPEWEIEDKPLGRGSYGVVYKAVRRDHNIESSAAIKVISIPTDPSEIDSLRSEGFDVNATRTYLEQVVNDFVGEIQLMESFKGVQNIVSVEDYKVVEKQDELGWYIFIRMELLTPLSRYFRNRSMTENEVIKLGMDICTALELCAKRNVIHRDIKPENIFVNQFGDFKLGDFGIARKLENLTSGLSQKGTYNYMAPEVMRGEPYDATVDMYSLGLVLYRFANKNRLPFLDTETQILNPLERTAAIRRRMDGEPLPAPCEASPALAAIIQHACSPDPKRRFASATAMKNALVYAEGNQGKPLEAALTETEPTLAVRPLASADPDKTTAARKAPPGQTTMSTPPPVRTVTKEKNNNWPLLIAAIASLMAVAVLGTVAFFVLRGDKKDSGVNDAPAEESAAVMQDEEPEAPEQPEVVPPPDVTGEWADIMGDNAYMNITAPQDGTISLEISAARSENSLEKWIITAQWDEEAQKYTYLGGVKQTVYLEDVREVSTTDYTDGTGSFSFENNSIHWIDMKENAGAESEYCSRDSLSDGRFQQIVERATQLPLVSALLSNPPDPAAEGFQPVSISSAWSSSTIYQQKCSNDPILLFDGKDESSWQEGVSGYGVGESVSATFNSVCQVKYLSFKLGNWRNDYYYYGNSKPKTMTITVGDYVTQITFENERKVQWVGFSQPIPASAVSLIIDDVYQGTSWKDTAICEMTIYGK